MSTRQRPAGFWGRNRWALPVLLALIILGVVLGFTLGPRLRSAASSPTATPTTAPTPRQAVVTATPASGTPATPPGTATGATPLPGSTPIPTEQGKTLGMITRPQGTVTALQTGANGGNAQDMAYVDPRQVVQNDLPGYGFPAGSFKVVSPAQAAPTPTPLIDVDGRPVVRFLVSYQGRNYQVSVAQPGTRGPKGIWQIVTILPPGYY